MVCNEFIYPFISIAVNCRIDNDLSQAHSINTKAVIYSEIWDFWGPLVKLRTLNPLDFVPRVSLTAQNILLATGTV